MSFHPASQSIPAEAVRENRRVAPRVWIVLFLALSAWSAIAWQSAAQSSVTIDEYGYVAAAKNLIESGDPRYSEWHAPLVNYLLGVGLIGMEFAPAPELPADAPPAARYWFWNRAEDFEKSNAAHYHEILMRARAMGIVLALALGLLVFFWARSMAPPQHRDTAGFVALALTLLHPELLAHGRLATLDVGVTFFVLLALWSLQRYVCAPTAWRATCLGLALGLAQAAKFTSALVALFALLVLISLCLSRSMRERMGWRRLIGHGALAFGCALFGLHAVYGGADLWAAFGAMEFESESMRAWQSTLPRWFGLPLPSAYVRAFDLQLLDQQGQYRCYLEGTTIQGGRVDYFALLLLRKTPLAGLAMLLLALVCFARCRTRGWRDSALLLGAAGLIFAVFSASQKQIGLRMVMPIIPLVAIWIAATSSVLDGARVCRRIGIALTALCGVATLFAHPYYLSYFNGPSGGSEDGYLHALGSNYDWGQDLPALRAWMEREKLEEVELFYYGRVDPEVYGIHYHVPLPTPKPGAKYLVVSASFYGMAYPLNDHGRRIPVDLSAQRSAIFENRAYLGTERITPAWFAFKLRE